MCCCGRGDAEEERTGPFKNRPANHKILQNALPGCQFVWNGWCVAIVCYLIGVVMIAVGVAVMIQDNSVVELERRYDHVAPLGSINNLTLTIQEDMDPPVYFYVKLTEFYQNHRRYIKSRSDKQLRGVDISDTSECSPVATFGGKTLYPCGMIGQSFMSDEFNAYYRAGGANPTVLLSGTNWDTTGIAWDTDREEKFSEETLDASFQRTFRHLNNFPTLDDERLMVWMRTATLPTFRKLQYVIHSQKLSKGDEVVVNVNSSFPVSGFSGEKSVVLATVSGLGGSSDGMGAVMLVVGCLYVVFGLIVTVKMLCWPRPLGYYGLLNREGSPTTDQGVSA